MGVAAGKRSEISTRVSSSALSLSSLNQRKGTDMSADTVGHLIQASVNRKNCTVTLRLTPEPPKPLVVLAVCCLSLTGCATYSVNSLPREYAARPTLDYSALNLAAWAQPAPVENQIRHGDRLELTLNAGTGAEDGNQTWTVGIDEQGDATLPNIGRVRLAGLSQSEAERTIVNESISRQIYLTPAVALKLEERQLNSVMVIGAVQTPGPLTFPETSLSLADIIVRSGGLSSTATGQITVNHATSNWDGGDQLTTVSHTDSAGAPDDSLRIDLSTTSAEELAAIEIPAGATIGVEESRPRTIRVIGVIHDRELEMPPGRDMRLLDALTLAGGPTYSDWVSSRVDIIRRVPGENRTIRIRASIRQAKRHDKHNLLLSPDDIVSVEDNPVTFTLSTLGGLAGLTNFANTAVP